MTCLRLVVSNSPDIVVVSNLPVVIDNFVVDETVVSVFASVYTGRFVWGKQYTHFDYKKCKKMQV